MRCPSCAFGNASDARFCAECGSRLPGGCPRCGAPFARSQRYCSSCGAALPPDLAGAVPGELGDEPGAAAERRLVSVLFVDLVGFTSLAEELDPEDVRSLQSAYFEAARSVILGYGGTLEKYIGDAVMAVWGAPKAHEDDGERALKAALDVVAAVGGLQPAAGRRLQARAAIATGEAAVTLADDGQGMLAGDLLNTAARLQQVAPAGGVLVDDTTRRVLGNAAIFEPAGVERVRGKHRRLTVWHARSTPSGADLGRAVGHPGPFIDRAAELHEIGELYQRVVATERSRLVSVIGIAGIGKSRLAWEFQRKLEAMPGPARVLAGHAPPYGQGLTFAPLAEMIRRFAGIGEGIPAEQQVRRLAEAVGRHVTRDEERAWIEPRVAALLDPGAGPVFEREELFAAWRRLFEHLADAQPTVLILEDMQWADAALLEFVEHLASWARDRRLLIITLARPELLDNRPTWGADQPSFTSLRLGPLTADHMAQLLQALAPALPAASRERVLERAGGVPLYGVEVARMLAEGASLASEAIPETLQSLIAARIDALPANARRTLLAAAVLGHRFEPDTLTAIGNQAGLEQVDLLVRREFMTLDDDLRSPARGQISFVQEVVREVAYRTLSRRERRSLHLAAAAYLERQSPDDSAESIAEHLLNSYQAAPDHPEAREVAPRAVAALRRAAARATALGVPNRALNHLQRALLLTRRDASRAELWAEAAVAARAAARFEEAEGYLRQLIDRHDARRRHGDAAHARAQLASLMLATERHGSALVDLETALAAIINVDDDASGIELAGQLARGRVLVGDDEQGYVWAERTLAAARRLGMGAVAVDALITRGTARMRLGDTTAGLADLQQAIDEASSLNLTRAELRARNNLAWLTVLDDPRSAMSAARSGMQLATSMGVADMAIQLALVVSTVAIDTGEWDRALQVLEEARDRPQAPAHRIQFAAIEATLRALRGEPTEASRSLRAVLPIDPEIDAQIVALVDVARAWIAFAETDFAAARQLAQAAAEQLLGADAHSALLLAARAATWAHDLPALIQISSRMAELRMAGRVTDAARTTLDAAGAALAGGDDPGALYDAALDAWRKLEVPLHLALTLAERDSLLRTQRAEGEEMLARLGAIGLLRLVQAG